MPIFATLSGQKQLSDNLCSFEVFECFEVGGLAQSVARWRLHASNAAPGPRHAENLPECW